MDTLDTTMARQIATAASAFQLQRTGHAPKSVTVVFGDDTMVITLHGALTPAEKVMAQSAAGAAQVQEFHRQLFASSSEGLRKEITRITGLPVQEAAAEIETATGTVVHAFTTGTMVQVFHLAKRSPGNAPIGAPMLVRVNQVNHEPGKAAGPTPHDAEEGSLPTPTHT